MSRLRHVFAALLTLLVLAVAASAQEPIRFARTPDISPDGKYVAFSYLGDIWIVETIGGVARPVTMHTAHEMAPAFSPDGRMLAFSSNRHGSYDVFVVPVEGGKPRRLTFDSANDHVNGWSPDGKSILFASSRSTEFPQGFELYTVPVEGGRERRITRSEGKEGVFSPKGDQIAYVRGPGTWYRKGYRGSSNDDIWVCNADGSNNRQLTTFDGQDTSPMWSPDAQTIYYVSECHGTPANIVRQDAAGKTKPQQVTFHKDDSVRRARISGNGDWIVYECGGNLWVVSTRDGHPRKMAIEVHADEKENTDAMTTLTQGATEFALAPDEKHVAFSVRGELFLMPITGGKPTRLTESPAYDHGIAWAPDGQKIIFASDRGGHEDLYLLEANDPEHPKFSDAHHFKTRQITDTPEAEFGVMFAPDGKRVGFVRAGKLWTMNPDGSDQKVLVNDVQVIDYDWSPDSKHIVYARMDGSFASELYIVPAAGGAKGPLPFISPVGAPRNITRFATYNAGVTWSQNGKKLAFVSQRRRTGSQLSPSLYVLSLQKPAAPGAPASSDIDWDDIHLRVEQPAPLTVEEGAISPDGNKVAFRATEKGDDLWVANSNGGQLTRVTTGSLRPQQITWSRKLTDVVYFRDWMGQIRMAKVGLGDATTISFRVKLMIKRDDEFAEMFEQSWRALSEHFYDPRYHGADWIAIRAKYRPLVKHVTMKEDLDTLISLMMGELNASHLGISRFSFGASAEETTAELGILFDERYTGPGLKIAEVLKRGPADKRGLNLKAGDIVLAIDDVEMSENISVSRQLNDKAGQAVTLKVTSNPADPKASRKVEVQAVSRGQVQPLMYERWVEHNAQRVAELSKGKLGYIHIPSMDDAGLDRFVRALYSDCFDKDGIVLDVRYNGGGFTHDQVLNYLGAKEHTVFRQRDGGEGLVLRSYDRKWTKPLVLLINNRSYSDAEIFPNAFRTLGLGKVVGQATGAHVIGTSSIRLIDGSSFRIPRTGVFTMKGVNMEKEGVLPDVPVDLHPDQLAKGIDAQLDKAVEVVQQDVLAWKESHKKLVAGPAESKPAGPTVTPVPTAK